MIAAVLRLYSFFHAFVTINSLPNGSDGGLKLAERVAVLDKMIVNQQFNIWHDEHHTDVTGRGIPHTTYTILEMESRIRALENKVQDQEELIANLKNSDEQNQSLKKTVGDLKLVLIEYGHRFQELERNLDDQKRIIADLQPNVFENNGHEARLGSPTNDLDIVNHELKNSSFTTTIDGNKISKTETPDLGKKDNQKGIQRRLLATVPQTPVTDNIIAFYAIMSDNTPPITVQHPLRFDVVKTNQGNAYHPTTGVFMVPQTGMYVFTWTVRLYNTNYHSIELVINTESVGIVHLNPGGDAAVGEVTGIVVIHADSGDDVFVRTYDKYNAGIVSSDIAGRSSFAGWKLA